MRVLITGITGMAGSHLAEYLLDHVPGVEIHGSVRWRSRTENLAAFRDRVRLVECDIRDAASVERLVAESQPDYTFHLAAQSSVTASWHAPVETLMTNINGQVNLLEVLRRLRPDCRILIPGTSEEYGAGLGPRREDSPLLPVSPYALSKMIQDLSGFQYARSYNLALVRTRAFNHTGPRRPTLYAEADFAAQIAAIERGAESVIRVGNLEALRDFTDVRDVVRGYWMAVNQGVPGEVYNLCSGAGRRIGEVLDGLLALSTVRPRLEQQTTRLRPADPEVLVGDCSRFASLTGWQPEIPFEKTLSDILREQRVLADFRREGAQNQERNQP